MITKKKQGKGSENCGIEFIHTDRSGKTQLRLNMKYGKLRLAF